uniref:Uncharacterized protein n=1 Tax=Lepeophtheirus salmonis TaxID=72036 RepID=A0A0K2TE01_LEPSM
MYIFVKYCLYFVISINSYVFYIYTRVVFCINKNIIVPIKQSLYSSTSFLTTFLLFVMDPSFYEITGTSATFVKTQQVLTSQFYFFD